jgi:hypothetical protein
VGKSVFKWFQRLRWTAKHKVEVESCIEFVKQENFATLTRGESLMDGMSADPTVILYGTVEEINGICLHVRVNYSVKYKATIDALGAYRVMFCDGVISEVSHQEKLLTKFTGQLKQRFRSEDCWPSSTKRQRSQSK